MRQLLIARFAVATLATASFASSPAQAQEAKQNFVLVNRTGYELSHVFVSPSAADDWGDDIMGKDVVSDGDSVRVRFERGTRTCKWDLKVTYTDDDSSAYWRNIDLCTVERITIRYNRSSDTSTATFD